MKLIKTREGQLLWRCSRWIKIRQNYNPCKRNPLWDYVTDGHGYGPYSDNFNPVDNGGLYLDYFVFGGKNYAIGQFLRMDYPVFYWDEKEDCLCYLSGYDCENYYNPYMIEIADGGEYVRVYRELTSSEQYVYGE